MANIFSNLFSLLCCLAFVILPDKVNSVCPLGWDHFGMSCFFYSHESLNWLDSQSSCRANNSRLAEVQSKSQSDLLMNLAKTNGPDQSYWLGGTDVVTEGMWIWASTGRAFNYTDWYPGEPDNLFGDENCLVFAYGLKWNDVNCIYPSRFVCEKEYPGDGSGVIG